MDEYCTSHQVSYNPGQLVCYIKYLPPWVFFDSVAGDIRIDYILLQDNFWNKSIVSNSPHTSGQIYTARIMGCGRNTRVISGCSKAGSTALTHFCAANSRVHQGLETPDSAASYFQLHPSSPHLPVACCCLSSRLGRAALQDGYFPQAMFDNG